MSPTPRVTRQHPESPTRTPCHPPAWLTYTRHRLGPDDDSDNHRTLLFRDTGATAEQPDGDSRTGTDIGDTASPPGGASGQRRGHVPRDAWLCQGLAATHGDKQPALRARRSSPAVTRHWSHGKTPSWWGVQCHRHPGGGGEHGNTQAEPSSVTLRGGVQRHCFPGWGGHLGTSRLSLAVSPDGGGGGGVQHHCHLGGGWVTQ